MIFGYHITLGSDGRDAKVSQGMIWTNIDECDLCLDHKTKSRYCHSVFGTFSISIQYIVVIQYSVWLRLSKCRK